ncbi:MAG: hypothetical protein IJU25_03210 [Lachnospiraceae bacterium]|nr:hypothetical protein [Lachnospiraceae bacterium]
MKEESLNTAVELAVAQIDPDKIDQWLTCGADEAYMETAEKLQTICDETPNIQYLYVYQIRPDGCHVVFDHETTSNYLKRFDEVPELTTDALGTVVPFSKGFEDVIPTLLEGGRIITIETNDNFGWLMTKYEPIYDSTGKCVAYVGADMSMLGVNDYNLAIFRLTRAE